MRAAARVFRARGFAAAGMRDIAVAADLSSGNLYHYFRGKNELLFFCQDRSLDRLLDALNWTAHWFRPEGAQSAREVAELVADYAVAGLGNQHSTVNTQHSHDKRPHRAERERRGDGSRVRSVQDAARGPA